MWEVEVRDLRVQDVPESTETDWGFDLDTGGLAERLGLDEGRDLGLRRERRGTTIETSADLRSALVWILEDLLPGKSGG